MITRRQTLAGAIGVAAARVAFLDLPAAIFDGLSLLDVLPEKLSGSQVNAASLEDWLTALHKSVHAPIRIRPTELLVSPEIVAYFGGPEATRAAYDDALRYLDTPHG